MAMSRQKTKEWIFEYLATHFEKTGELLVLTPEDIAGKTSTRIKRIESLLGEMVEEEVLYLDQQGNYRYTPSTFDELVEALEHHNRLPEGYNPESDYPEFPDAPSSPASYEELMSHFASIPGKQSRPFDETEALQLMEKLRVAHDSNNKSEFDRISEELESMGCTVRMKPNNEFGVLFPPEFGT